jgi:hypothetical protein
VEYEKLVEDVAGRPRARALRPVVEANESPLAPSEQVAVGPATGASPALRPAAVIGLQRTAGNAAVAALIQRRATLAEEEEPSSVRDVVGKGGGEPLDPALRQEMEGRLGGADLSPVRVHTDAAAARSAVDVAAAAYTVGDEIVFGADTPALDSDAGKRMLAHELTHVMQQRQGPVSGTPAPGGISISNPSDVFEQAAEANAEQAMSARMAPPAQGAALQRAPAATDMEEEEEEGAAEEYQPEAGEAEQAVELAEAGQEETVEEATEEEGEELEVEEDQLNQAGAELETTEEEEEEAAV